MVEYSSSVTQKKVALEAPLWKAISLIEEVTLHNSESELCLMNYSLSLEGQRG